MHREHLRDALNEVLRSRIQRLRRLALRILRNPAAADDVVQEVAADTWAALRNKSLYVREGETLADALTAYMTVATSRRCQRRAGSSIQMREERADDDRVELVDTLPSDTSSPEQALEQKRLLHTLQAEIDALPRKQKEIMHRLIEDQGIIMTAADRKNLERVRRKLRELFEATTAEECKTRDPEGE